MYLYMTLIKINLYVYFLHFNNFKIFYINITIYKKFNYNKTF